MRSGVITGNGMLTKKLSHYKCDKEVVIFAAGMSNAKETRQAEFYRGNERLIYFDTCSVCNSCFGLSAYSQHDQLFNLYGIEGSHMIFFNKRIVNIVTPSNIKFINLDEKARCNLVEKCSDSHY